MTTLTAIMHTRDVDVISVVGEEDCDSSADLVAVGVPPTCAMHVGLELARSAFVYVHLGLLDDMFTT